MLFMCVSCVRLCGLYYFEAGMFAGTSQEPQGAFDSRFVNKFVGFVIYNTHSKQYHMNIIYLFIIII